MIKVTKEFYNEELETTSLYTEILKLEKVKVREIDDIIVQHRYWEDSEGEMWVDFDDPMENPKVDFIAYRQRKGYITPEKVKCLRKDAGLTVRSFANYLGMGVSTLSQLENNLRVQTKEQDVLLSLVHDYFRAHHDLPEIGAKNLIDQLEYDFEHVKIQESAYVYQDHGEYDEDVTEYDSYNLRTNREAA